MSLVIGKFPCLLAAINALDDFTVDPALVCEGSEVIFINKSLRDNGELYVHTLRSIEGRAKIKIGDIEAREFGILCGEDAV